MVWLIILIIILVVPIVYFKGIIKLSRIIKNKRGKKQKIAIGALLLVILVPFGDLPLDLYRFNKLCNEESGIFIYQKVGLSAEFFYTKGEEIKKVIFLEGSYRLRTVPAKGDEIKLEKLKQYYRFDEERYYFNWSEDALRSITTVWDGETRLGQSVRFRSGLGWFFEAINPGPRRLGYKCPPTPPKPSRLNPPTPQEERNSQYDPLIYGIFYKTDEKNL